MGPRGRRARPLLVIANNEFYDEWHAVPAFGSLAERSVNEPGRQDDKWILRAYRRDRIVNVLRREGGARTDDHRVFLGKTRAFVSIPAGWCGIFVRRTRSVTRV